ncbi:MAG: site-2 protease family protein [Pseudomonadota bacterium]
MIGNILYIASVWALPMLIAITFHEAAHGYVAEQFGDPTARRLGRVTLNPLRHIDPFGTILLPALLVLASSPFLFGYAKPVPVDVGRLRHPRRDMVWVALAGPAMNLGLAMAAALLYHGLEFLPPGVAAWGAENLRHALVMNVMLAIFNMLPIPPLDGGRVAVGVLPDALAFPLARLERVGIFIVLAAVFLLPELGRWLKIDLDVFGWLIRTPIEIVVQAIVRLAGLA